MFWDVSLIVSLGKKNRKTAGAKAIRRIALCEANKSARDRALNANER